MNKKCTLILLLLYVHTIYAQSISLCEKSYIEKMISVQLKCFSKKDTWDKRMNLFITENPTRYSMYIFNKDSFIRENPEFVSSKMKSDTFAEILEPKKDTIIEKLTFEFEPILHSITNDSNVILYSARVKLSSRVWVDKMLRPRYSINTNYAEQPPQKRQLLVGSSIVTFTKIYIIPNNKEPYIPIKAGYTITLTNLDKTFYMTAIVVCEDPMR